VSAWHADASFKNPGMPAKPGMSVDVRSYGTAPWEHRHEFVQLVLPLSGRLNLEIGTHGGEISPGEGAFVGCGERHSQMSARPNRSLIVDLAPDLIDPAVVDRLLRTPFVPLSAATGRLVDYMGAVAAEARPVDAVLRHWLALLLDSFGHGLLHPRGRLDALLISMEAEPGHPWTVAAMAARAGLSVSRLHALFQEEMQTSPRAWLSELRLRRARGWLAQTDWPIAEIAYRGGYADQSALTRAMRKATGMTPGAYRRRMRESASKTQ